MKRFCATVEYDGTEFFGFQRQRAEFRTVQGALEQACQKITQKETVVLGSGRTDSGVHATGQVVAFDLEWSHGELKLLKALNANLPPDVSIIHVSEVSTKFHPRFDAKRRSYQYYVQVCDDGVRHPLTSARHWQIVQDLDLELMNRAAAYLIGTHDFATFGQPTHGESTTREIFEAQWSRPSKELLVFEITGNAFLYRMVRSIVGTLKVVGEGSWSLDQFLTAFQACDRSQAATTAPAHGLYLVSVTY